MDLCDFFKRNEGNSNKCKVLQNNPEEALSWEQSCSASEYSPGLVQDHEILHRQIFHPIHWDEETGTPKPTLFDDASSKGMSVNRANSASNQTLLERGRAKAKLDRERRPDRQFLGLASASCVSVRQILTAAGARAFCVFDTALADDPSHADICQIVSGKQEGRSVRSKLRDAFKDVTLVERNSYDQDSGYADPTVAEGNLGSIKESPSRNGPNLEGSTRVPK